MSLFAFKPTMLVLKEIAATGDQANRSYECTLTPGDIHRLGNVLDKDPHAAMSQSKMDSILGNAVMPSADYNGMVNIPYGWGVNRFSFVLTGVVTYEFGSTDHIVVEGFTEYPGVAETPTGEVQISPTMKFFPNMVKTMRTQDTQKVAVDGTRVVTPIISDTQTALCLNAFSQGPQSAYIPQQHFAMTPTTILHKTMDDFSQFVSVNASDMNDHRGAILPGHVTAESVGIQNPSKIGGIIAAATGNATWEINQSGGAGMDTVAAIASNYTTGGLDSGSNPFFIWVAQCGNGAGDFFTYPDLARLSPELRPTIIKIKNGINDSEYWTIRNDYTVVATVISQVVSSLVYDLSLAAIEFNFDTRLYDATLPEFTTLIKTPGLIQVTRIHSIYPGQVVSEEIINKARMILRDTMLSVIAERRFDPQSGTFHSTRAVNGVVACQIWDRTVMQIKIDEDQVPIRYEAQTYASGLTTAAITSQRNDLDTLAAGLGHIVDTITEHMQLDSRVGGMPPTTMNTFQIPTAPRGQWDNGLL